ncbi:MAG: twin-arginine translocation signal domain-containing protein, partial [Sphingomonas sp.]
MLVDSLDMKLAQATNRRRFLAEAAIGSGALIAAPALAQSIVDLHLPGGPSERPMTSAFPGKGNMILQRI